MTRTRKLAVLMTAALTVAPIFGASAFAESRHRHATNERGAWRQPAPRVDQHRAAAPQFRGRNEVFRNDGRRGTAFEGRVNRVERFRGGYHVWVGSGRYPLFVPEARFRVQPFRVGVSVRLGGYWDPLGDYNVYDSGLRGIVERVDDRYGTVVIRDDISGRFVTTVLRGDDPRLGSLRPGDYVELNGSWSRAGVFDAFSVAYFRARY